MKLCFKCFQVLGSITAGSRACPFLAQWVLQINFVIFRLKRICKCSTVAWKRLHLGPWLGQGWVSPGDSAGCAGASKGKPTFFQVAPSEKKPAQLPNLLGTAHGSCWEAARGLCGPHPHPAQSQAGIRGLGSSGPTAPDSLGMLDGAVQGAEKRPALLHHAVEVGLVKEVALGVAEVLGTEPGRGAVVRREPGALAWCSGAGGGAGPSLTLVLPAGPSPAKVHLPGL